MLSFFLQNFGCRVNQAEAFAWAEILQAAGLWLADDWSSSDVIIVNTCTLTGRADRDVIRFLRKVLRESPSTRLAITGCASEHLPQDILGSQQVILTVPNADKEELAARLLALIGHRERPEEAWRSHGAETEEGRLDAEEPYSYRARAFVKIQDGCDNRCTFCIIPSVRGGCQSVPVDDVVRRIQELTADGFREIVLAGIHLSSYGEEFGGTAVGPDPSARKTEFTLSDLLRKIGKVPGLGRVRLSSLDPRKIDDAFIAQVAGDPMICQHFHLSLQHASAGILRRMGRPALPAGTSLLDEAGAEMPRTAGELGEILRSGAASSDVLLSIPSDESTAEKIPPTYEALLLRLRTSSPEAAIGADIIVGFPGETEEDFATLETFLERSPLSYFHVFSYSPRRGTPAAGWPQVPGAVKSVRARRLRRLSAAKNLEFRQTLVGKDLDAIVISMHGRPEYLEGDVIANHGSLEQRRSDLGEPHDVIATALAGGDLKCGSDQGAVLLTGNYLRVSVPNCPAPRRDLIRVRITRVLPARTEGTVI